MKKVTIESLATQIDRLYRIKEEQGQLSLDAEYRLEAYKLLLDMLNEELLDFVSTDPIIEVYQNKKGA